MSLRATERPTKVSTAGQQSPYDVRYAAGLLSSIEADSHARSTDLGTHFGRKPEPKASEERPSEEAEAPGTDVEMIIMGLYSKMKNLEGKYIDLANFYKQELLVKSNQKEDPLASPRSP